MIAPNYAANLPELIYSRENQLRTIIILIALRSYGQPARFGGKQTHDKMNIPFLSFAPLSLPFPATMLLRGFSVRNMRAQGGGSGPGTSTDDVGESNSCGSAPSNTPPVSAPTLTGDPASVSPVGPAPDPALDPRNNVFTCAEWELIINGNPADFNPPPSPPANAEGLAPRVNCL